MSEKRGLEWNILVYRIVNDFVFNNLIAKIDPPIMKNPFEKGVNRVSLKSVLKILIFGLALIAANCYVFVQVRKPNLFEYMGLSRACSVAEIDAAYTQSHALITSRDPRMGLHNRKTNDYTEQYRLRELNEIRDILKNKARRVIYDKHGITESTYAYFLTSNFMIQCILQTGISYLILLIASITGNQSKSNSQNEKSAIKWQVLLIINFFLLEVYTLQADSSQADWIDMVFPSLTIQHRIHFLKILLVPVSIIVQYLTQKFQVNRTHDIAMKLSYLKNGLYAPLNVISNNFVNAAVPQQGLNDYQRSAIVEQGQKANEMLSAVDEQAKLIEETFGIVTNQEKQVKGGFNMGSAFKFLIFAYLIYSQVQ